jgi:hypothetical protein
MYYYGNGSGTMAGGYYPYGAQAYPTQTNNSGLWAILLVIFILFIILGCGWGGRGCGSWGGCC